MKKTNWKYIVDTVLFICIVGLAVIGFILGFVVPKGPAVSENAKYFLGLHRHQWGDIHLYLGIIFTVMAILHLVLAWDWVKGKTRQLFGEKWKAVLIAAPVAAMVVLALFWVSFLENPNLYEEHGVQTKRGMAPPPPMGAGQVQITGQTTLADVERQTGISANEMARALDLPPGVSSDETLGRLKKEYPLTVEEVRDAVTRHSESREETHPQPRAARQERPVEEHAHEEPKITGGRNAEVATGILITGQMSLYDIERQTGVPAQAIANQLRIPSGVSFDERLGWLRRSYGFTMQDVREAVSALMVKD